MTAGNPGSLSLQTLKTALSFEWLINKRRSQTGNTLVEPLATGIRCNRIKVAYTVFKGDEAEKSNLTNGQVDRQARTLLPLNFKVGGAVHGVQGMPRETQVR